MTKRTITHTERGFWQMSDTVGESTVMACTKECTREDCRLSVKVKMTALAGKSEWYDKTGRLHIRDTNDKTSYVCCSACWDDWIVKERRDEPPEVTKLERHPKAP